MNLPGPMAQPKTIDKLSVRKQEDYTNSNYIDYLNQSFNKTSSKMMPDEMTELPKPITLQYKGFNKPDKDIKDFLSSWKSKPKDGDQ